MLHAYIYKSYIILFLTITSNLQQFGQRYVRYERELTHRRMKPVPGLTIAEVYHTTPLNTPQ